MPELPLVSALMPAYNAERFVGEAIESALGQDYPAGRLEVVVVDDGSTDATAAVVAGYAERHPGRVRLSRQANAGPVAATNAALAAASGDLLAMLDADDAWPPGKIRRQVELLAERPEVGLVYGDMRVIDADGRVIQDSWLVGDEPPEGRCVGSLLLGNAATASSIVFRASLRPALEPIPAEMPYNDWWFAVRAAQVSEVAYLPEPRTLYRFHGANLTLGTDGPDRLRELRKALRFQRWFLRRLEPGTVSPSDLLAVWEAFERNAREVLELAGSPFAEVVEVTRSDAARARELTALGEERLARGEADAAMLDLVRAAACDPWHEPAREGLVVAAAAMQGGDSRPGQRPLEGARPFVVRADAEELLAEPRLLGAYARALSGAPVTLAIDASALEPQAATEALGALAADAGLADDDSVDLLAVLGPLDAVGRARLAAGTHARYGGRAVGDGPPAFTPATLHRLRALAAG